MYSVSQLLGFSVIIPVTVCNYVPIGAFTCLMDVSAMSLKAL